MEKISRVWKKFLGYGSFFPMEKITIGIEKISIGYGNFF